MSAHMEAVEKAISLTNQDLDRRVPSFGSRETPARNSLYNMVAHPKEHAIHITKILQETHAPNASPTESQMILAAVWQSMAEIMTVCDRLQDADLERTLEGETIQGVLEHVRDSYISYANRIAGGGTKA
ncbi:MAG: hypothetical protein EXR55_03460 [Dehalococcoidia bacterium]|nr:hypothetical protein [Dehalococcoidia bacterium]